MGKIAEIFEDESGGTSFMRVASAAALLQAMSMSWYGWVVGKQPMDILITTSIWVAAAFIPKALQKIVEVKGVAGLYSVISNKEETEEEKPKEEGGK